MGLLIPPSDDPMDTQWTDYEAYIPWWKDTPPMARHGLITGETPKHIGLGFRKTNDPSEPYVERLLNIRGLNTDGTSPRFIAEDNESLAKFGATTRIEPDNAYVIGSAYKEGETYMHEAAHFFSGDDKVVERLEDIGMTTTKAKSGETLYKWPGKDVFIPEADTEHMLIDLETFLRNDNTQNAMQAFERLIELSGKHDIKLSKVVDVYHDIVGLLYEIYPDLKELSMDGR